MMDLAERRDALIAKHAELTENRRKIEVILERIVGQVALIEEMQRDEGPRVDSRTADMTNDDDETVGLTDSE